MKTHCLHVHAFLEFLLFYFMHILTVMEQELVPLLLFIHLPVFIFRPPVTIPEGGKN